MTRRSINWNELDRIKEVSQEYQKEKEILDKKDERIRELKNEIAALEQEKKNDINKPKAFDEFGILNYIRTRVCRDTDDYSYGEARIEKVTDDTIVVRAAFNYGHDLRIFSLPLQELEENGYCYFENDDLIFVDEIRNYNAFKKVLDILLLSKKACIKRDIKIWQEFIAEHTEKVNEFEKSLKEFDNYPMDKLTRLVNSVDFPLGISRDKRKEFEDQLPRVYKI